MIFLLENRAQDLMTLLVLSSSGGEKTNTNPKRQRGSFGEIPKTFLSPNGYPNHHLSNCIWCNTFKSKRQKLHSNVAPAKTNSIGNKFQISKYQLTSTKLFASTSGNTKTNSNHRITTRVSTANPANQILIQYV